MLRLLISLLVVFGMLVSLTGPAKSGPVITVDMDPTMPGVQPTLTVMQSTTFTVDVVVFDDVRMPSPSIFDIVGFELSYNNMGIVLGAGPTGPLAGALAGTPITFDLFSVAMVVPGSPLMLVPSSSAPGFASGTGAMGLSNSAPFFSVGPLGPAVAIASIDFTAIAPGTSTLLPFADPAVLGPGGPFFLQRTPVPSVIESSQVTVLAESCAITIIKEANPEDDTEFPFTIKIGNNEPDPFSLMDPSDDIITFPDVPASGTQIIISEEVPSNWVLDDIVCEINGNGNCDEFDPDNTSVTCSCEESDVEITCTFLDRSLIRPIPTLNQWAMAIMVVMLGLFAMIGLFIKRRRGMVKAGS